ncbi:JNK-interacting protein 1-like [Dendronephthya gigantea]|uniref:JNK-interacting protein 1-like n=1 Tax=Dendronephthya gigantea TaxID=151771 RepID=UPI001069F9E1|nr:JNK-interacting protein 1-like [Dendronephthya gigantea]
MSAKSIETWPVEHPHVTKIKSNGDKIPQKNGMPKTTQQDISSHSPPRRTLTKTQSSTSLVSPKQGSNSQEMYEFSRQGSRTPNLSSKGHLVPKGNGYNTIGHEPGFRRSLPHFSAQQQTPVPVPVPISAAELQTHFAVYKFLPRHHGELSLNVGDAVCVKKIHEDLWCEGRNLHTGESGIFPNRYVSDVLSHTGTKFELSDSGVQFFLRFLGSVQVREFKGNTVLCQAIANVLRLRNNSKLSEIPPCTLEIDYRGIQLIDHAQESEKRQTKSLVGRFFNNEQKVSNPKFFFKLRDVTFCGCYPNSPRYFGFVTKHPSEHRFACHTFMSEYSTEPVAKAIGQAFKRLSADHVERSSSR